MSTIIMPSVLLLAVLIFLASTTLLVLLGLTLFLSLWFNSENTRTTNSSPRHTPVVVGVTQEVVTTWETRDDDVDPWEQTSSHDSWGDPTPRWNQPVTANDAAWAAAWSAVAPEPANNTPSDPVLSGPLDADATPLDQYPADPVPSEPTPSTPAEPSPLPFTPVSLSPVPLRLRRSSTQIPQRPRVPQPVTPFYQQIMH
ncbi:hypothetical protein EUX98_g7712 [Antrodiella citrinella]|uniref:Uncharacterized protein n=1 Tax=Antrodiella citrinella TaxID=2447956 RepID=A0A4S4MKV7_9APHY|nr:hypothetical protein EUX98_g7712 [Antrodiella citrinella]